MKKKGWISREWLADKMQEDCFKKRNHGGNVKDCFGLEKDGASNQRIAQYNPLRIKNIISDSSINTYEDKSRTGSMMSLYENSPLNDISEGDMKALRNQQEIKDILLKAGITLRLGQFQNVWQRALDIENHKNKNQRNIVSIGKIMESMRELRMAY